MQRHIQNVNEHGETGGRDEEAEQDAGQVDSQRDLRVPNRGAVRAVVIGFGRSNREAKRK